MKLIKRLINIVVVIVTLIYGSVLLGYADQNPSEWSVLFSDGNNWAVGTMEKALDEIENTPISDLTVHDGYYAFRSTVSPSFPAVSPAANYLHEINDKYPVERVEKIDDEHVFAVYKIKENGQTVVVRVPFKREIVVEDEKETERWLYTGSNMYFATKELRYSDYESIKIGDCAADAVKVDDTTAFMYPKQSGRKNDVVVFEYEKLLNDGLIRMYFAVPQEWQKAEIDGSEVQVLGPYEFDPEACTIVDIFYSQDTKDILDETTGRADAVAERISVNDLRGMAKKSDTIFCVWVMIIVGLVLASIALTAILVIHRRKRAAPPEAKEKT